MNAPLVLPDSESGPERPVRTAVTGDVPGMTRDAAWAAIARLGGEVVKGVGPKTDLLVVGPGSGKKVDEARVRRIRVVSAADFAVLAGDPSRWDGLPVGEVPVVPVAPVREPDDPNVAAHRMTVASGWFDGAWAGKGTCSCGWTCRAAGWQAADTLGRAHSGRGPDCG